MKNTLGISVVQIILNIPFRGGCEEVLTIREGKAVMARPVSWYDKEYLDFVASRKEEIEEVIGTPLVMPEGYVRDGVW